MHSCISHSIKTNQTFCLLLSTLGILTVKRAVSLLVLLSLTFLSGCGLTFTEFSAPDGSFKIKLPGTPKMSSKSSFGASAQIWELEMSRWKFSVGKVETTGLAASAFGAASTSQILSTIESAYQTSLTGIGGKVNGKTSVTLNGFPGTQFEISVTGGSNDPSTGQKLANQCVVTRFFAVNNKIYIAECICKGTINKDSADVKTFMESFSINETAGSGASAPGAMAAMPGMTPGAMPGAMPGMTPMPGTMPPGSMPPGTQLASAGTPGTYNSAGTYNSGTPPMPMMTPMPNGTYTPPGGAAGTYNSAGTTPMPSATYDGTSATTPPMAGVPGTGTPGTYNSGGATPMPSATYNGATTPPTGIPGATNPMGANPMGLNPMGANPMGMDPNLIPGQLGIGGTTGFPGQPGNRPNFTGTPVTADNKISVGDILQAFVNGQWVDVKVQRVGFDGSVQVRTQNKPTLIAVVPRNVLQFAPGAAVPGAPAGDAVADRPETDASGLPGSKGLPGSPATSKPRTASASKAPTTATKEVAKGTGSVSLDGASVDELIKIIANKNEHRRIPAAEKLAEHSDAGSDPEVAKKLTDLLKLDELTVRAAVAKALEKWATPEINEIALKNLTGGTTEVRQSMMRILANQKLEAAITPIARCVADKDDRKVAMESLIAYGEPALPEVIRLMSHADSKVKLAACEMLKEIGTPEGQAALKKATETWSGTDRIAARKALQALEAKK